MELLSSHNPVQDAEVPQLEISREEKGPKSATLKERLRDRFGGFGERRRPVGFPLHVSFISVAAGMDGHGARYLAKLTEGLVRHGAHVSIIVPKDALGGGEMTGSRVTVYTSSECGSRLNADRFRRYGPFAGAARGLRRLTATRNLVTRAVQVLSHQGNQTTVVHFLDYEYLVLALTLLTRRRLLGRHAVVVTVHPSDFDGNWRTLAGIYKGMMRHVLRMAFRRVDALVCHGEWIAARLRQQLGFTRQVLAHPYPSYAADERHPLSKEEARRAIGVPPRQQLLLWFGVIRRNKRVDIALKMLAELPRSYSLLVAGKATEVSSAEIVSLAQSLGVTDRLFLHLRYIDEQEIPAYFHAADALVATHDASFTSASGPVSDARTYGLPVIVSDVGQLAEYVRKYGVGVVAQPGNPKAFAKAARRLLEDERVWEECVANALRAAKELSWESFADAHWRLYNELLPTRSVDRAHKAVRTQT